MVHYVCSRGGRGKVEVSLPQSISPHDYTLGSEVGFDSAARPDEKAHSYERAAKLLRTWGRHPPLPLIGSTGGIMTYQYRITVSYPDKTSATHRVTANTVRKALSAVSPGEVFDRYVGRVYTDSKGWIYAVSKRERVVL